MLTSTRDLRGRVNHRVDMAVLHSQGGGQSDCYRWASWGSDNAAWVLGYHDLSECD